jgi:hypothetical protein
VSNWIPPEDDYMTQQAHQVQEARHRDTLAAWTRMLNGTHSSRDIEFLTGELGLQEKRNGQTCQR